MTGQALPSKQLPVLEIIRTGWQAFARSPWMFVGFTLIGGIANLIAQGIQEQANTNLQLSSGPFAFWILIALVGVVLNVIASLWMNIGLFRGAWKSLAGQKPAWIDFLRWDSQAMRRLFLMALLLFGINILILIVAGLAGGLLSMIRLELSLLPLIAGALVIIYVAVTQMFHLPLVVAKGEAPLQAFKSGRGAIDPQFWRLLGFGVLMLVISLVGLLIFGVGLLVAAPVVVCSLVAAYQHLFDREDNTGFLNV